jgi:pilus assembly protein Flp/PilA
MKHFKQILVNLVQDESGQDLIEYALVAALIALGSVAAMGALSTSISTAMSSVGTKLTTSV